MNNYASNNMNEYNASVRPGSTRAGSRFAPPVRNPEHAEPWDQISDEHRNEINDCVSHNLFSSVRIYMSIYNVLRI